MLPPEATEFSDELPRLFLELSRSAGLGGMAGECAPPIDVYETDDSLEIAVDLPGVDARAVRIVAKGTSLLIAGEKAPRRGRGDSSFHLVERGYGRFARTVRLSCACDTAKARAALVNGELRISVPKLNDRRNRSTVIPIATEPPIA